MYFQPPPTVTMTYPCIVYSRSSGFTEFADNRPYQRKMRYQVTVIDKDPDSPIPGRVAELPSCIHNRWFARDNLNHDVFSLHF